MRFDAIATMGCESLPGLITLITLATRLRSGAAMRSIEDFTWFWMSGSSVVLIR